MNAADRKQAKRLYDGLCSKCRPSAQSFLAKQVRKAFKPMKKARLEKEQQKRLTKKEEWEAIKADVRARSGGRCEVVYMDGERCGNHGADVDHWENGNGRRVEKQSVENCWHVCRIHHRMRQEYDPSVWYWNQVFAQHCAHYQYPFIPHIEHAPFLKSSTPSVPAAGSPLPAKGIGGVDLHQLSEKEG